MERLTKRIRGYAHGAEGITQNNLTGDYCRGEFEATACVEKLAEYEDLEEQGKLLRFPCVVGDRIYRIDTDEEIEHREIEIYNIDNIVILSDGTILLKYDTYDGVICELENIITDKPYLDYYRCFLDIKEAEAILKI